MILAYLITCIVIGCIVGSVTGFSFIGVIAGGYIFFSGLPMALKYSFINHQFNRVVRSVDRNADRVVGALDYNKPAYDLSALHYYDNRQVHLHAENGTGSKSSGTVRNKLQKQ